METINLNQMSKIEGGVSPRDCYLAGMGLVLYIGWSNIILNAMADLSWDTTKECFGIE